MTDDERKLLIATSEIVIALAERAFGQRGLIPLSLGELNERLNALESVINSLQHDQGEI